MSMRAIVAGIGGAGNHAVIDLIERGVIDIEHARLLNTTSLDVPEKYTSIEGLYFDFSANGVHGTGKQSDLARSSMVQAIKSGKIKLDEMLYEDTQEVILVSSLAGGSSGATPIVAKYFEAMNIPVHVFCFLGYLDEAREFSNTLKYFQKLPENVILHTIMNSHFLDYTKNYIKGEQAANIELAREVEILLGSKLIPSKQCIDDQDLYKLNVQPGYTVINHIPLTGIKNTDGFNAAVAKVFEDPCYLDCDQSAKRIGVIINASRKTQEAIDNSYEVLHRYVGTPIEVFQHIQSIEDGAPDDEEYMDVIVTGLNFPERAIKDLNRRYEQLKEKLNTGHKSFADIYGDMDFESDDMDEFNIVVKRKGQVSSVDDLFAGEIRADYDADPAYARQNVRPAQTVQIQQPTPTPQQNTKKNKQKQQTVEQPSPKQDQQVTEVPTDTADLKKHQFVNTTVNQTIYGPTYEDVDETIELDNPMEQKR